MEGVRDVREKGVIEAQRAFRGYVYLMVEEDVVNSQSVVKVHKEVLGFVKHMAEEEDANMKDALKVPREVHHSVKHMEVEKGVHTVEECALKVSMEVPCFVSHMGEVSDAL